MEIQRKTTVQVWIYLLILLQPPKITFFQDQLWFVYLKENKHNYTKKTDTWKSTSGSANSLARMSGHVFDWNKCDVLYFFKKIHINFVSFPEATKLDNLLL